MEVRIDRIEVARRFRKDLGDLTDLKESINRVGVIQPVLVTPIADTRRYRLIAGERRLESCKRLGLVEIPAHVVGGFAELVDYLIAERDENTCRKDFTPSEAVAIGAEIEKLAHEEAKKRQGERNDLKEHSGDSPECSIPQSRDIAAKAVGMSGQRYDRAKKVVQAAEKDPSLEPVVAEMDRSGNVSEAYKRVKAAEQPTEKPAVEESSPEMDALLYGQLVAAWKSYCSVWEQCSPEAQSKFIRRFDPRKLFES